MSKLLSSPKALLLTIVLISVFVVSVLGGALGNAFGLGFLSSSLPAIQLPAEIVLHGFDTPIGKWDLMNTMLTTWLAMVVLIILSLLVKNGLKEIPGRLQALFEVVFEFFLQLCESVAGKEKARRFFPLVFTIFVFMQLYSSKFKKWFAEKIFPRVYIMSYIYCKSDMLGDVFESKTCSK